MRQRGIGDRDKLLKGLFLDLLVHKLTCSKVQCRENSSKSTRNINGGTKLTRFRVRARGADVEAGFSWDRAVGRSYYSLVELSSNPAGSAQVGDKSELSINLKPLALFW